MVDKCAKLKIEQKLTKGLHSCLVNLKNLDYKFTRYSKEIYYFVL